MNLTDWTAVAGVITGTTGMVLGIVTTIDMLMKSRVKLRVTPKIGWKEPVSRALLSTTGVPRDDAPSFAAGRLPDTLSVEITNLSAFPVTVSEVGMGRGGGPSRQVFVLPEVSPGYEWPAIVQSRRSVTVHQALSRIVPNIHVLSGRVYVKTECGAVKSGASAALDWLVAQFNVVDN